jgi:hypothetical protein
MIAVAMTMLVTLLPSAATMPIASTNSGNAMIVSAMRPTMLVDPAAEIAGAMPASPPSMEDERDRGDGDEEIEPRRRDDAAENVAAELVGAEPVRRARRLQRLRRCCSRADRKARAIGAEHAASRISANRPKAKPVTGFSPTMWRACAHRLVEGGGLEAQAAGGRQSESTGSCVHGFTSPSSLTRGSITP